MKIYIGCSGYNYKDWKGKFYPEDSKEDQWLEYYSSHFNTVEINNTFYKFPTAELMKRWVEGTPDDFRFTIKANRYLSHMKKLKVDESFLNSLKEFNKVLSSAKEKLDCVLWQLPGNLHKNESKIRSFCSSLDHNINHVVEFRHKSWFDEEIYDILSKEDVSYCILSAPGGLPEDMITTTKVAYIRFHGKSKWYDYFYSDEELEEWKKRITGLKGIERVYTYFNNDHHANAVKNAQKLKSLLNS